ncbi:MAG TPA: response regulator [Polyangiaceae bacterium]
MTEMASDPFRYFRIEAREILEGFGKSTLELEKSAEPNELVGKLFRLAHTLKGAARVVRQRDLADLAHAVEDALEPLRAGSAPVTRSLVDELLRLGDAMREKLDALGPAVPPEPPAAPKPAASAAERRRVTVEPAGATATATAPADRLHAARAGTDELDALAEGVAELGAELAAVRAGSTAVEAAHKLAESLHQRLALRAVESRNAAGAQLRALSDELVRLLGSARRDVTQGLDRLERELRQVGESAERLRLVPASAMFVALERAARDAAVSVGKQVTFETTGGDTRLDPEVLSAVQAALVQAVRNAVAHGLETESERHRAGKPSAGRIGIDIARSGNLFRFVCSDDGRGVDFEAVRRSARERGHSGTELGDEALAELLLAGGISTSGEVSLLSGRGVGLDIVRETAERLGGNVALSSRPSRGTTLTLTIPVARSALDALMVESDGQIAAIPLRAVRRAMRLAPDELTRSAEVDSIVLEGRIVPFSPLGRSLGTASGPAARRAWSAVVVEAHGSLAVVGVDRLLGTETIVARPLPDGMPPLAAVAGTTLDANGNPRLVVDPEGLVTAVERTPRSPSAVEPKPAAPILVIDDSLTTRMLERSILESEGYAVELASSAEEGLEKARAKRYALFLVDVEMPGIDGFTFVERTRADPELGKTPAILVTSRSSDDDKRRGAKAGASAYIVKGDFDQNELLEKIRFLLD